MELQQPRNQLRFSAVVGHVIGREPEFIHPDIDQEYRDETGEVEDILLDRNRPAHGWRFDLQGRTGIREDKEAVGEKEVEAATQGYQNPIVHRKACFGTFTCSCGTSQNAITTMGTMNSKRLQV